MLENDQRFEISYTFVDTRFCGVKKGVIVTVKICTSVLISQHSSCLTMPARSEECMIQQYSISHRFGDRIEGYFLCTDKIAEHLDKDDVWSSDQD